MPLTGLLPPIPAAPPPDHLPPDGLTLVITIGPQAQNRPCLLLAGHNRQVLARHAGPYADLLTDLRDLLTHWPARAALPPEIPAAHATAAPSAADPLAALFI